MLRNSPLAADRYAGQPASSKPWMLTVVWTTWDALQQALAAWRQYERLMSRGISHEAALRLALDIAQSDTEVASSAGNPEGRGTRTHMYRGSDGRCGRTAKWVPAKAGIALQPARLSTQ